MVYGGYGSAGLWRVPEEEAALSNHSAQSPASAWVASPGHWGTARSNAASAVCSRAGGACTWGCGRAGHVVLGVAIWPVCGDFQRRRQHPATTARRALPVCEWPVLGIPEGTARPNEASAVCHRGGGACTGACCRAGQVVSGGCDFDGLWSCPEEEAALGNHSAQSPVNVWVASSGHTMGHCEVKCSLCSVK